jgi:RNA polymerase-binding transcription factor DksA
MDDIDRAQIAQMRDTEIAIKKALSYRSMRESTGYCDDCGEVIPQARIDAINATTCIECAKKEEKRMRKWA